MSSNDDSPLGALSYNQYQKGIGVLGRILQALNQGAGRDELLALSNEYYTIIPHAFGGAHRRPPVIDDPHTVQEEWKKLEKHEQEIQLHHHHQQQQHQARDDNRPEEYEWQFDSRHGWFNFYPEASQVL